MSLPSLNTERFREKECRPVRAEETLKEAILAAFEEGEIDLSCRETILMDWINCDALDDHDWNTDRHLRITTVIWDHVVVITDEAVTIYGYRAVE